MANEKEKAIDKDQETITPTGAKKEELSEKDLDKASGGGGSTIAVENYKGYVEVFNVGGGFVE